MLTVFNMFYKSRIGSENVFNKSAYKFSYQIFIESLEVADFQLVKTLEMAANLNFLLE